MQNKTRSMLKVTRSMLKVTRSGASFDTSEPPSKTSRSSMNTTNSIYIKPGIYAGGDFEKLIKESSIFVDKSLFIKEILESKDEVTLVTAPRRWGKSLNLDMTKRFLSVKVDETSRTIIPNTETENYKLFAGGSIDMESGSIKVLEKLKIASDNYCMGYQGRFPVIFIDFKDCKRIDGFAKIEEAVKEKIIDLFLEYEYLGTSNNLTIKDRYNRHLQDMRDGKDLRKCIKDLSRLLHKYHNQRVWILIDEYDAVVNEAYRRFDDEETQKVVNLFRDILESSLKGNEYLYKGVITGVQYIVKSGMLSGLNNVTKYSIQNYKYSQYYGINQDEMDLLLSHFNIADDQRGKIKEWYNGYQEKVANTGVYIDKYNIWSVVQYLNKPEDGFIPYWEESGSIDFMQDLFSKTLVKDNISDLVDGASLKFNLYTDFSVQNFKTLKQIINLGSSIEINSNGLDVLFSYFFITGYLTEDGNGAYKLPNNEIRHEMGQRLLEYYRTIYTLDSKKLDDLIGVLQKLFDKDQSIKNRNEKIDFIKKSFISKFQPTFNNLIKQCRLITDKAGSIDGIFANEDVIHSILNYIGMQVTDIFFGTEIYINKFPCGNKGRIDIILRNKETGIIIEVKYNGNAHEALAQAKTYKNLISDQYDKIFIGLDISKSEDVITSSLAGEIYIDEELFIFAADSE